MPEFKPVTIVGGGIAGLTLGIALRHEKVPVTLWEAGRFPRHRVCGEFISGKGLSVLSKLGLLNQIKGQGARLARTAAFFGSGYSRTIPLPEEGLCCSRYTLDQLLAAEFVRLNGDLREQKRWSGSPNDAGVVMATGRRIRARSKGWRWLGLKAHARQVACTADLEIHLMRDSYIGLCEVERQITNVCGLFRSREPWSNLSNDWTRQLRGSPGTEIYERTAQAQFDPESFCSVTGLSFAPETDRDMECRVGDRFGVIAPIAGNGMSIALESADLACKAVLAYSGGGLSWAHTVQEIQRMHRCAFTARLRLASCIQSALFHPILRHCVVRLLWHRPRAIEFLFQHMR